MSCSRISLSLCVSALLSPWRRMIRWSREKQPIMFHRFPTAAFLQQLRHLSRGGSFPNQTLMFKRFPTSAFLQQPRHLSRGGSFPNQIGTKVES